MRRLEGVLEQNGFTEKQARVYVATLELRDGTVSDIARRARLKRPTVYVILKELEQRAAVSPLRRGAVLTYHAVHPHTVCEQIEEQTRRLREVLPELAALGAVADPRPELSVFEGDRGLRLMMEETLTTKGEILYWADMAAITKGVFHDYWRTYIRKRVARGIRIRGILCGDKLAEEFQRRGPQELREAYLVPRSRFPFTNEINIYDDKVAIISHEDLLGIVLKNRNIAQSQRSIFNLAFEYAKILDRKR